MDINKDQNTEQAILDAAEKLFLDKGFAMTTTTEIAKAVGCNQALVHYYFRTKEKLFTTIFENKAKLFISQFIKVSDENIPFMDKLKQKVEAHFDLLKENPKLPFLLFNELTTNPERAKSIKEALSYIPKTIFTKLNEELKVEIENGRIRPISAFDLVYTIVSLNVMLFIAKPIFDAVLDFSPQDYSDFIERRKHENVKIIIESLKP
jgi:AcrR family transcriptional regulator